MQELRGFLRKDSENLEKRNDVKILIGLPACGKTTYARNFSGYEVFSSDAIREEHNFALDNKEVFAILHERILTALAEGKNCIYDATNISRKDRARFLSLIENKPYTKTAVLFITGIEECKRRNALRKGVWCVPDYVYDRMLRRFNMPLLSEGFDAVEVMWDWESMGRFDVDVFSFKQDNPHHELTLGEHLVSAAEYLDRLESGYKSNTLFWATISHDIGKTLTKKFEDSHGNPSKIAHYYGHENAGAYLFLTCSEFLHSLLSENEILAIATLIEFHMRPYVWSKSAKACERDRKLLGEELFYETELLHEADRAAH